MTDIKITSLLHNCRNMCSNYNVCANDKCIFYGNKFCVSDLHRAAVKHIIELHGRNNEQLNQIKKLEAENNSLKNKIETSQGKINGNRPNKQDIVDALKRCNSGSCDGCYYERCYEDCTQRLLKEAAKLIEKDD